MGHAEDFTEYLEDVDDPTGQEIQPGGAQPEGARRFMAWLQREISAGNLRVNEPGAAVHMVREGMLLVSPRIFREFAGRSAKDANRPAISRQGGDPADRIKHELLRAGWHLPTEKGGDMSTYQVRREGHAVAQVLGVVIKDPVRFINPVPPINPALVRLITQSAGT
jgi:hypothetical protein